MSYSTGAGVYANPAAAGQDIQRSHQYLNYDPQSSSPPGQLTDLPGETYDTVSLDCPDDCIDRDIDGAPVADANGAKTYSNWNLNLVDYPTSPPDTSVFGINDANMGWLNSGSYVPAIFTGGYCTNGCVDGEPDIGFYWQSGNFVSVDSYLNGETKPYGVNNFFQIVGHYYPYPGVSGPEQGFFFSSSNGGSAYPLNYPNAASVFPYGINDAGQIVGAYSDTANKGHAFFTADQDTWTGIDHSGQGTFFRESTGLDRLRATTRTLRATTDLLEG